MAEWSVSPDWIKYLGPVAVAQFIDEGWMREWPLMMTRAGQRAIHDQGFGMWEAGEQKLPRPVEKRARLPDPIGKPTRLE